MYHGKFQLGDRVRVHLYNHHGLVIGAIEGTISDFAPDTEVAPGMRKNLVYVTGITRVASATPRPRHPEDEGLEQDEDPTQYKRPNDLGELEPADEGWFADTDMEKVEDDAPRFFAN